MVIGYARVSTPEQKLESQIDLLKNSGCEIIYSDIASGTRDDRKGLNEMLKYMRKGDTILTYKNDRVFRSLKNMVQLIDRFNESGVHFKSLSEPEFNTNSANGKLLKNTIMPSIYTTIWMWRLVWHVSRLKLVKVHFIGWKGNFQNERSISHVPWIFKSVHS